MLFLTGLVAVKKVASKGKIRAEMSSLELTCASFERVASKTGSEGLPGDAVRSRCCTVGPE